MKSHKKATTKPTVQVLAWEDYEHIHERLRLATGNLLMMERALNPENPCYITPEECGAAIHILEETRKEIAGADGRLDLVWASNKRTAKGKQ